MCWRASRSGRCFQQFTAALILKSMICLNNQLAGCSGVTFGMCGKYDASDSPQCELCTARSPKCLAVSNKSDNPEIVFPSSSFPTIQPSIRIAFSAHFRSPFCEILLHLSFLGESWNGDGRCFVGPVGCLSRGNEFLINRSVNPSKLSPSR